MAAQKKGPAEVAASPSHGSNNPTEGNVVNRQHDTTTSAGAATFDPFDFAERLHELRMLAHTASMVSKTAFEDAAELQGLVAITKHEAELISFLADHVQEKASSVVTAFDLGAVSAVSTTDDGSDPLLFALKEFEAAEADAAALDDGAAQDAGLERVACLWKRLVASTPNASSIAGAVAALDYAVADIGRGPGPLAPALVRAARAFLAPLPRNADPLLDLVRSYEAGMAAYNGRTDEGDEAIQATYGPSFDALTDEAVPQPTTMEGALAALRLLVREGEVILDGQMVSTVLPAVLGFLEREAA